MNGIEMIETDFSTALIQIRQAEAFLLLAMAEPKEFISDKLVNLTENARINATLALEAIDQCMPALTGEKETPERKRWQELEQGDSVWVRVGKQVNMVPGVIREMDNDGHCIVDHAQGTVPHPDGLGWVDSSIHHVSSLRSRKLD